MKIQLRTPSWEDMEFIRRLWADEETMRPVGGPIYLTDGQALRWYRRMVDPGSPVDEYRLILNEEQHPVGEVSYHQFDPKTGTAMFDLKVASTERGKGYARAAMRSFLDIYFNVHGGRIMLDDIALDNLRGQDVFIRFGFVHDPRREDVFSVSMNKSRFNRLQTLDYK